MSLVQQWKCQDNAASTTVAAAVGSNGTLDGGDNTSTLSQADGPGTAFPRSLLFNGVDDDVDISAAAFSRALGSAFTFCCWFKATDATSRMIGRSADTAASVSMTTNTAFVITLAANFTYTVPAIGTTLWRHLAITADASNNMRVWIDGVESSTGAQTRTGTFNPTHLMRRSSTFGDARIADVRLYDSDESASLAAIMAEKDSASSIVPLLMHRAFSGAQP